MKLSKCLFSVLALSMNLYAAPADEFVGFWRFQAPNDSYANIMKIRKIDKDTIALNYCTELDFWKRGIQCEAFEEFGGSVLLKYNSKYGGFCNNYTKYVSPFEKLDDKYFECLNGFKISADNKLILIHEVNPFNWANIKYLSEKGSKVEFYPLNHSESNSDE